MYVQITTRCNMTCAHCCFACTAKGTDMSEDTFKKAIEMAVEHESHITIGGGEPTLHPKFKDFLMHAVWELASVSNSNGNPAVFLVTNVTNEEICVTLAQLAERGVIGCRLSQDQYHDQRLVSERVRRAFKRPQRDYYAPKSYRDEYDCRDTNGEIVYVQAMGRAKSWGNRSMKDGCCGGLFITPKGTLYPCECKRGSLGTVHEPKGLVYEHFSGGYCCQSKDYKSEVLHVEEQDNTVAIGGQVIKV